MGMNSGGMGNNSGGTGMNSGGMGMPGGNMGNNIGNNSGGMGNNPGGMGMNTGNNMGNNSGGMGMNSGNNSGGMGTNLGGNQANTNPSTNNQSSTPGNIFGNSQSGSNFYFYNPQAVQAGRQNLVRTWGNFALEDNWRRADRPRDFNSQPDPSLTNNTAPNAVQGTPTGNQGTQQGAPQVDARYLAIADKPTRLAEIPGSPEKVAATKQSLEKALMETGKLYYQVLKENPKALEQLDRLVREFPQTQFAPEALYTLLRVCREVKGCEPDKYKAQLLEKYPKSPYTRLLNAKPSGNDSTTQAGPEAISLIASAADTTVSRAYGNAYLAYQAGQYQQSLANLDELMMSYPNTIHLDKITIVKVMCQLKLNPASPEAEASLKDFSANFAQSELVPFAQQLLKTIEERRKGGQ